MTDAFRFFLTLLDLAGLILLVLYFVQMGLAAVLPARRLRFPAPAALKFTFVIPALNEGLVIGATVETLRALAPEAQVVVVDDASDDDTGRVVQALAAQDSGVSLLRRTLPQARQGKGLALNWAVQQLLNRLRIDGADLTREIFVIVDADGRITPELLGEASSAFADGRVMGAQARVRIRPSVLSLAPRTLSGRMLEQQQDMEFFIIRHLQHLRQRWHSVGLFGNGQFMRASYVHEQFRQGRLAWPDCLLEDFASGVEMRLAAPDHRMIFLDSAVTQQGLPDLRRFIRQRARWTQGAMQCLGYLPRLWSAGMPWLARLDLSYFILGPWLNAVIVLSLLTQPFRWAFGAHGLILDPLVSALITGVNVVLQLQWVARYQREHRLNTGQVLFTLVSLPVYGFALLLSLPLAYWNHFSGRRTWDKSSRHVEPGEAVPSMNGD
ncbi:glycosyltransferase [Deinococcus sonorensis]|uniref:Glycosyltransferase n=2 Tax=Deinococcus sonorensis TaxID=309891 RepID=A0AAU7UBL1_9DEIO